MTEAYQPIAAAITIQAGINDVVDFDEGAGTLQATVAPGVYYLYGQSSGGADAESLSDALEAALNAASALAYDVGLTFDVQPGQRPATSAIANAGFVAFKLEGTSTFPLDVLGHVVGVDTATASLLQSTISCSHTWISNQPASIIDPGPYERDTKEHVAQDGGAFYFAVSSGRDFRNIGFEYTESPRVFPGAVAGYSFRELWAKLNAGLQFRLFSSVASSGTITGLLFSDLVDTYTLTGASLTRFAPARPVPQMAAYNFTLAARKVV